MYINFYNEKREKYYNKIDLNLRSSQSRSQPDLPVCWHMMLPAWKSANTQWETLSGNVVYLSFVHIFFKIDST